MIPYFAMLVPFSLLGLIVLGSLVMGVRNLWTAVGGKPEELLDFRAHFQAVKDVLKLKYLDGGGHGCNYPDDRFSMVRRYFHHAIFYGFLACLASTTVALVYDHFLGLPAPYPFWSVPVLLGTIGGTALLIGTAGMLYLKIKMDRVPASPHTVGMDVAFTGFALPDKCVGTPVAPPEIDAVYGNAPFRAPRVGAGPFHHAALR